MILKPTLTAVLMLLLSAVTWGETLTLTLGAAKDSFGRSNEPNQNSGGNVALYLAHNAMLRGMVAFDLSSVTNEIISAELCLQPHTTNENPFSMVVAPMVSTPVNDQWTEGTGALGAQGRNAQPGESTYSRCAYPDVPWETASDKAAASLGDSGLWRSPVARLKSEAWTEGEEIRLTLDAVSLLEQTRNSQIPIITFGLWGTAGKGYYTIMSKESGRGPQLILSLKE